MQAVALTLPTHDDDGIFGSFYLIDSEFAIPISRIQEVINPPDVYTTVPLAPPYLVGMFNLRGTIIPVIDLKKLLNFPHDTPNDVQKIAIIVLNEVLVGLLFDRTGEVVKDVGADRSDFDDSEFTGVIQGVIKKESGKRIIQILDVNRLFNLPNLPKEVSRNRLERENRGKNRGDKHQCISFLVGDARCALPISAIQEIIQVNSVNESALGVGACLGTIDLRGSTVPVIDFAALLQYRDLDRSNTATHGNRRIIMMRLECELFGLLVDSIDSIVPYFPDELLVFPLLDHQRKMMFSGCISGDVDILLLDHQQILTNDEINAITRGHSKLYQVQTGHAAQNQASRGIKRSYITFTVGDVYAIPIIEIREILNFPDQLLHPPRLNGSVCGVLNLRGELVSIIDARALYQSGISSDSIASKKVMVFKRAELLVGLVVDSIESIVHFYDSDKLKMPKMGYQQRENDVSADIVEAVEITDSLGQKKNMLILSVESILDRALALIAG